MRNFLLSAVTLAVVTSGVPAPVHADGSFVYQPAFCMDDERRGPAEVYEPQPGDVYMSTDKLWLAKAGHVAAFSGPPHHSGIVFARPDGSMGLLEAGPFNGIWIETIDVLDCFREHARRGETVWVRRRRTPLTAEQSKCLTEWALAQEGKRFAVFRLMGQITILRSRGPLRTEFLGGPHGERSSYFCSELVMESCVHVGLVDPTYARPSATYPRDLFFDDSVNRFLHKHPPLGPDWYPPSRWTSEP